MRTNGSPGNLLRSLSLSFSQTRHASSILVWFRLTLRTYNTPKVAATIPDGLSRAARVAFVVWEGATGWKRGDATSREDWLFWLQKSPSGRVGHSIILTAANPARNVVQWTRVLYPAREREICTSIEKKKKEKKSGEDEERGKRKEKNENKNRWKSEIVRGRKTRRV